jgi:hypothetical protein
MDEQPEPRPDTRVVRDVTVPFLLIGVVGAIHNHTQHIQSYTFTLDRPLLYNISIKHCIQYLNRHTIHRLWRVTANNLFKHWRRYP